MRPQPLVSGPRSALLPIAILLLATAFCPALGAQVDGDPDLRYSSDGFGRTLVNSNDGSPWGVACAIDGTCYTASTSFVGGDDDFRIRRYSPAGLDLSQGAAAFQLGGDLGDLGKAIAVQVDGKAVVVGQAADSAVPGDQYQLAVARFAPSGAAIQLDNSFSGDGKVTVNFVGSAEGRAVAMAPDGKIVIAGCYETNGAGGEDILVVRLDSTGALDPTFDGNGIRTLALNLGSANDDCANSVVVQSDGKIVVAGESQVTGSGTDFMVVRLQSNGALDPSFSGDGIELIAFNLGGSFSDEAYAAAIDSLGRIVVGGSASFSGGDTRNAILRLSAGGVLDAAFGNTGTGRYVGATFTAEVRGVEVVPPPSNRILFLRGPRAIGALTDAGQVDTTWSGDGFVTLDDPEGDTENGLAMTLVAGMPVVTGFSIDSPTIYEFVARYHMDQIFGDDFESQATAGWSWPSW